MRTTSVGVVGLGALGAAIAARLRMAGFPLTVYDIDQAAMQLYVVEGGSELAASPQMLAEAADVVLVTLSTEAATRDIVLGGNGLVHGLRNGAVVVDMSVGSPEAIVGLDRALVSYGVSAVDAIPFGRAAEIETGRLTVLAGGSERAVERASPVLKALGERVIRTGGPGTARAAHAINGLLIAIGLMAAAEGLLIGKRYGLDPAVALEVINASTGASTMTLEVLPRLVREGRYLSGTKFNAVMRGIDTALELAHGTETSAPIAALCREICLAAKTNIEGVSDATDIVRWLERMTKTDLAGRR
jgi:3-hydroxyisobutyrate dehydrogenase